VTDPDVPWFRRPALLGLAAVVVLALGVGIGLLLASGDDGDTVSTSGTTDTTIAPTTTAAPPTTAAPAPTTTVSTDADEAACVGGDQVACDRLPDDLLEELCDGGRGSLDACQVLLAHQGDGDPDGPDGT
jgi:hypothetical protein